MYGAIICGNTYLIVSILMCCFELYGVWCCTAWCWFVWLVLLYFVPFLFLRLTCTLDFIATPNNSELLDKLCSARLSRRWRNATRHWQNPASCKDLSSIWITSKNGNSSDFTHNFATATHVLVARATTCMSLAVSSPVKRTTMKSKFLLLWTGHTFIEYHMWADCFDWPDFPANIGWTPPKSRSCPMKSPTASWTPSKCWRNTKISR